MVGFYSAKASFTADTDGVTEPGGDYWERQFRESDARAALLSEATTGELVELHYASHDDCDLGSMCFAALQRRARTEVRAEALRERRASTVSRRAFAASLLSMATRSAPERASNLPLIMAMLRDRSPRVVDAAMQALHIIQVSASGDELGRRLRTRPADVPAEGWQPMPGVIDIEALASFATHRSPDVRTSLARAMWLCGEPSSLDLLLRLTRDIDPYVRGTAADMLGSQRLVGGPMTGVLERLREMADSDPSEARFDAIASLVDLGDEAAQARVAGELEVALDRGLPLVSRYQLVHLLYKEPALISKELQARLANEWRVNFAARVPSELLSDE
jgi:hypothetical protein